MMRRWIPLLMGGLLLLGGCTLAPTYERPAAPVPSAWPAGGAYAPAQAPPDEPLPTALAWRAFFADPQLQAILAMALENNRDLRLAALNVERARALYGIQRAELFPAVSAVGAGAKQRRSADLISPGNPRTVEQYSVDLGLAAWEIDLFGRIRSLKDQALEAYLATEGARRSARIALIAEVARVYLTLAADRENLQLARSTLEAQQASYDIIAKSFENGLATEIDLRRARIQVETARRDIPRYTQLAAQDRNALDLLAGGPVPDALLKADLGDLAPLGVISAGLSSHVLLNRPDIMALEHRLKGANAFIGAARAAFFPRISLTATMGTASDELSGLFTAGTHTWNFAPQAVLPIFDARTWAALRVSKADREIVLAEYEKGIQVAFREVADALAVRGTIHAQRTAQQALVDAAAEAHRLSKKRYEMGIDTYLSVLVAHQSLYGAQQGLVALRLAELASQVQLYAVLGGGADDDVKTGDRGQNG